MKVSGTENQYLSVSSRLNIIIEISQGLGPFIGGFLSDRSFTLCYLTDLFIVTLSMLPLLLMKEPPVLTDKSVNNSSVNEHSFSHTEIISLSASFLNHFKTVYRILRQNPSVVKILLYYPVVTSFDAVLFFYGQQYFADYGLTRLQISSIMVVSSTFSCLTALMCTRILAILKEKTKYIISVCMGLSILFCAFPNLQSSIVFFILANTVNALIYPIESSSLNALIPSAQRATIISVDSMCYSLSMILFFPLCGAIATRWNLHITFTALGILQLCLMLILFHAKRTRRTRT